MIITRIELDLRYAIDEATDQQLFPELITFFAKPLLEKDWRKKMQEHWALTEKEKEEKQHEFNVGLLLSLAHKAPKGLPGFEAEDNWQAALASYFSEESEAKKFLAKQIVDEHINKTNRYSFRN